ncbi:hypothetical protein AAY473_030976 [Plecturocebus cupreus]
MYLIWGLTLLPRLECSGANIAHYSLKLLGSIEMEFHHVGQADLKLLSSNNLPASVPQSAGIAGMSHHAQPNRQSLTLLSRVEYSGVILAYCNLCLHGSSNSHASASWVAGIIDIHHHAQLIFVFLVETGFCHVGLAGLELLASKADKVSLSLLHGYKGSIALVKPSYRTVSCFMASQKRLSLRRTESRQQLFEGTRMRIHPGCLEMTAALKNTMLASLLEFSGIIKAHCSLKLLGSSDPPALDSQSARVTGMGHHAQPKTRLLSKCLSPDCPDNCQYKNVEEPEVEVQWYDHGSLQLQPAELKQSSHLSLLKMRFCHVAQAGLELLASSNPPAWASQSCAESMVPVSISGEGLRKLPLMAEVKQEQSCHMARAGARQRGGRCHTLPIISSQGECTHYHEERTTPFMRIHPHPHGPNTAHKAPLPEITFQHEI